MSENTKVLKALISCDKLISVDKRLAGRRYKRGLHLSWEYEHELNQLAESLKNAGLEEGSLGNDSLYGILYVFYLKENFLKRDADNLIKAVTDSISRYLGFNDNRIISYKVSKRCLEQFPDDNRKEYVYFEIEKINKSPKDFKIKFNEFTDWIQSVMKLDKEGDNEQ